MFEILEKKVWLPEEPRIVEFLVKAPRSPARTAPGSSSS